MSKTKKEAVEKKVLLKAFLPFEPGSINEHEQLGIIGGKNVKARAVMFHSTAAKDFKKDLKNFVPVFEIPHGVTLRFELILALPENQINRTDLDNRFKILIDQLFKIAKLSFSRPPTPKEKRPSKPNDSRIWELAGRKKPIPNDLPAYCMVTIFMIPTPPTEMPSSAELHALASYYPELRYYNGEE